jgi:hypothetical protein
MARQSTHATRAVLVVAGVVVLQALLVAWFAWPSKNLAPRDLPIVVAGPAPAAAGVVDRLRTERPGAFQVGTVADSSAADAALRNRTAYAAIVLGPSGPSLHIASAASPTVATLVTQAGTELGNGQPVPVVDVVPGPSADPRGAGFAASFLPLLITSLACGAALLFVVGSHLTRLAAVLGFGIVAGLATAAVMHGLGVITGSYLLSAAVIALVSVAISGTVTGLGAVLGPAGIGIGALLVVFLGNPISGITGAPELLPKPWGTVGQLMPPGAGSTLLRSTAFFDGAGAARPLWVLAAWSVAGLGLTLVGHYRGSGRTE